MTDLRTVPIQRDDLDDVARFLHENLSSRIPPETWRGSFTHDWSVERPNYGFMLLADGVIAGVLCAIYSDQEISGRLEKFCNPHSWCVLDAYRKQSVDLVVQLLKQKNLHFTMLSPNPSVAEVFRFFRFKSMDTRTWLAPNIPVPKRWSRSMLVTAEPDKIASHLSGAAKRNFEAHRRIPWLEHVLFGDHEGYCHVVFKVGRWRRLRCADVLYASSRRGFRRHFRQLTSFWLRSRGIVWTRAEARLAGFKPMLAVELKRYQPKFFLSERLTESEVQNLYTELVALDL